MQIRKLATREERYEASLIILTAFHMRTEDPVKRTEKWTLSDDDDWAAFADDGRIAGHVINHPYRVHLDGEIVRAGGVGAVSTLPEYRNTGAIRKIFEKMLPDARANGEVVSILYPFSHGFYRKFGYESVAFRRSFDMKAGTLTGHRFDGEARPIREEDIPVCTEMYNAWAKRCNLALRRDNEKMSKMLLCPNWTSERRFSYLLSDADGVKAYVAYEDVFVPEAAHMAVHEAVWADRAGFEAVLGFLARFTADYGTISMTMPTDIDLRPLVFNPYEIKETEDVSCMVRVMNTEKLLAILGKRTDESWTVRVSGDEITPENNGCWRISPESVTAYDGSADIELSARALGPMAVGGVPLYAAALRGDVRINANRETLEKVFAVRPIYIGDHF